MNSTSDWKNDESLELALCEYNRRCLHRKEVLTYMKRDFAGYPWSMRTLDRRLRYFNIYHTDKNVTPSQLKQVLESELKGPGQLLGYRAMLNVVRQKHRLNVPRDAVHNMMFMLDEEGLKRRQPKKKKDNRQKGNFTTKGVNWVHSLDGHCKLMGYQRDTFPLAIYGCLDTASRKILFLKVWTTNSDPKIVAKWYFDYLNDSRVIASKLRMDKGTETGLMATMHAYIHGLQGEATPQNTVLYGPSTSNQVGYVIYCRHFAIYTVYCITRHRYMQIYYLMLICILK